MEKKDFENIEGLEFWGEERFKNRSLKIIRGPEVVSIQYLIMLFSAISVMIKLPNFLCQCI